MNKKEINDLINLIEHTRIDISYGSGGTYADIEDFEKEDKIAINSSLRAINIIKRIIINGK